MDLPFILEDGLKYDLHLSKDLEKVEFPLLRHISGREELNTIRLLPPAVLLEVEDFAFHHNSAVTLPCLPTEDDSDGMVEGDDDQSVMKEIESYHPLAYERFHSSVLDDDIDDCDLDWPRITLVILAIAYEFLEKNPTYKLLLAGHADTTGSDEHNFTLSDLRAEGVYCLLMGDRERWVEIAEEKSKVEDYQRICNHYADRYSWPCYVGTVDDVKGGRTRAGLKAFQTIYNEVFDQSITEDGLIGPQTWAAIFDCYIDELARLMSIEVDQLPSYRNNVRLVDEDTPWIGCGERLPIEEPSRDSFRSLENRRVEMLFFAESNKPDLQEHLEGGLMRTSTSKREDSLIYANGAYSWVTLVPQWWELEPPSMDYKAKFKIVDFEGESEERIDEPDSVEYDVEVDEIELAEDENPFAAIEFYSDHDFGLHEIDFGEHRDEQT